MRNRSFTLSSVFARSGLFKFYTMEKRAKLNTCGYTTTTLQDFLYTYPRFELEIIIECLEGVETQVLCAQHDLDSEDLHQVSMVNLFRQSLKKLAKK